MMTEDEWESRYGWLDTDMDGSATVLSDDNLPSAFRKLLAVADSHYVWSEIDGEDSGYEIVPGFQRTATGWYVTSNPWETGDERVERPPV
jgi:hypothetical protein